MPLLQKNLVITAFLREKLLEQQQKRGRYMGIKLLFEQQKSTKILLTGNIMYDTFVMELVKDNTDELKLITKQDFCKTHNMQSRDGEMK